jgi:hypothetical protein
MIKKNVKSRKDALAAHYMMDIADVDDYRYHAGLTNIPVYAFDRCYVCVTKGNQKPAKHRDGMDWEWKEIKDDFINQDGWRLWESEST